MIRLWADFNAGSENGLFLNCKGTIDDLARQKIELKDGMELLLWNENLDENNNPDNLIVEAIAKYCCPIKARTVNGVSQQKFNQAINVGYIIISSSMFRQAQHDKTPHSRLPTPYSAQLMI